MQGNTNGRTTTKKILFEIHFSKIPIFIIFMEKPVSILTRKNCFRYLKLMSPLNAAICTTISYTLWVEWYYLKNNHLTLRSKSHKGHYGMRHTALWSCTHIPNIIDLSGKTKKLWSGQASLRRSRRSGSGRKNQTKTICLPSFEEET